MTRCIGLSTRERFNEKWELDHRTGCWNWTDRPTSGGYGALYDSERKGPVFAHRFAYEWLRDDIPEGLVIDHLCRNRLCVNPDHMEVVTNEENIARGEWSPIRNAKKTHCKRGHEFTPENTRTARNMNGRPTRVCATCYRMHSLSRSKKRSQNQ